MRLIGHRGARGEAPENTLGGFRYLHQLGVRAVEFDVRMLKDGTLAVIHDDNLMRTAGIPVHLNTLGQADLFRHHAAFHWSQWPDLEPIPTLSQTLLTLDGFEHIEVELKAVDDLSQAYQLVERTLRALSSWRDCVVITSFDLKILQALQHTRTPIRRGLLIEQETADDPIDVALRLGCSQIGLADELCHARRLEQMHAQELKCSVWTVNDIDRARQLAYWGVDGLITDYPKRMIGARIGT